jgi:hypothetical protein
MLQNSVLQANTVHREIRKPFIIIGDAVEEEKKLAAKTAVLG